MQMRKKLTGRFGIANELGGFTIRLEPFKILAVPLICDKDERNIL